MAAYETLRERFLNLSSRPASDLGLNVLLRQGMLAWLRAQAPVPNPRRPPRPAHVDSTRVATDLHDELIHAMVAMTMASNVFKATAVTI